MQAKWLTTTLAVLFACSFAARTAPAADWDANLFKQAETLDLRTIGAEGEYWFPVWVVVVDDQVFVRLGSRAAERIRENQSGMELGVRVNDVQFDKVQAQDAPEYVDRVAAAMAEKYWSDIFVRFFAHPMTLRLSVAPPAASDRR